MRQYAKARREQDGNYRIRARASGIARNCMAVFFVRHSLVELVQASISTKS